jgi:hypothetical protein
MKLAKKPANSRFLNADMCPDISFALILHQVSYTLFKHAGAEQFTLAACQEKFLINQMSRIFT